MGNSIGGSGIACPADVNDNGDRLIEPDCSRCDQRAARPRSGGEDRRLWYKAISRRPIPVPSGLNPRWLSLNRQVTVSSQAPFRVTAGFVHWTAVMPLIAIAAVMITSASPASRSSRGMRRYPHAHRHGRPDSADVPGHVEPCDERRPRAGTPVPQATALGQSEASRRA
jgi:hypothetical protein